MKFAHFFTALVFATTADSAYSKVDAATIQMTQYAAKAGMFYDHKQGGWIYAQADRQDAADTGPIVHGEAVKDTHGAQIITDEDVVSVRRRN